MLNGNSGMRPVNNNGRRKPNDRMVGINPPSKSINPPSKELKFVFDKVSTKDFGGMVIDRKKNGFI